MNRIWITWEMQRRSIELAKKLNCTLYIIEEDGSFRYPKVIWRTIQILIKTRPEIVFVQNPSMILAAFACLYKILTGTPVVVDRHTTFLLDRVYPWTFRLIIFKLFHLFTIKWADLTIVTNEFLANIVSGMNGKPYILPDPLPNISMFNKCTLRGKMNILMISSFGVDEPISEVTKAMGSFNEEVFLYVTGNDKKIDNKTKESAPPNVIFTGFLDDKDFVNMLFSVDAIMVLTTAESCMLCGCYEAVAAKKPLITSDKEELKKYFSGAVFVDNTALGIKHGIIEVKDNLDTHKKEIIALQNKLVDQWENQRLELERQLSNLIK